MATTTIGIRNVDAKRLRKIKNREGRTIVAVVGRLLDLYEKTKEPTDEADKPDK